MKKLMILVVAIIGLSGVAKAGFWSGVASGLAVNAISSPNHTNSRRVDHGQTEEMKVQQALYGLGVYTGNLDGNLNTMASRKAINHFQKSHNIRVTGILEANNKQHLLYLHELYTSLIKLQKSSPVDKIKRNLIYDEIDKAIELIGQGS